MKDRRTNEELKRLVGVDPIITVIRSGRLRCIIVRDGHIEAELQKRMSNAILSFGRLRERLRNNHNVSIRVKGKIYREIILASLLYGAERHKRCIGVM